MQLLLLLQVTDISALSFDTVVRRETSYAEDQTCHPLVTRLQLANFNALKIQGRTTAFHACGQAQQKIFLHRSLWGIECSTLAIRLARPCDVMSFPRSSSTTTQSYHYRAYSDARDVSNCHWPSKSPWQETEAAMKKILHSQAFPQNS